MAGPLFAAPIPTNTKAVSYPSWWFEREVIPQKTQPPQAQPIWPADYAAADDFAVANIGQLKQTAAAAYDEFSTHLPSGAGTQADALVKSWFQLEWAKENGVRVVNGEGHAEVTLKNNATGETGPLKRFEIDSPHGRSAANPNGQMCKDCAQEATVDGVTTSATSSGRASRKRQRQ